MLLYRDNPKEDDKPYLCVLEAELTAAAKAE